MAEQKKSHIFIEWNSDKEKESEEATCRVFIMATKQQKRKIFINDE